MATNQLYHTWLNKIMQLIPDERVTRIRNLAWLVSGIFLSRSVQLSHVASKMPGQAVLTSTTRRLDRFLENSAIRVRDWYEPVVEADVWIELGSRAPKCRGKCVVGLPIVDPNGQFPRFFFGLLSALMTNCQVTRWHFSVSTVEYNAPIM